MGKKIPKKVVEISKVKKPKVDYSVQKSFSYSQLSTYHTCPHRWYLDKVEKHQVYEPSIHTVFGTALHETIQKWLDVLYTKTVKEAQEMDLDGLLLDRMRKTYKKERYKFDHINFSNPKQLQEFYLQGKEIMDFLVKKRSDYFFKKKVYLAGIETPITYEVKPNVFFIGYIDLVFYDETLDEYTLIDIKTSTRGWNDFQKKDETKQLQLVLYKYYFSKIFDIPLDKINVQFFICKREVPEVSDWVVKRVQIFEPASGRVKIGKAKKIVDEFVENVFDDNGEYVVKDYKKNPSEWNCKFCNYVNNLNLCQEGING